MRLGLSSVCVVLGLACFARSPTGRMGTFKKNDKIIDRKGNLRDYPASQKTEVLHEKLKTVLTIVILKFMISTLNFTKFQSRTYNPGFQDKVSDSIRVPRKKSVGFRGISTQKKCDSKSKTLAIRGNDFIFFPRPSKAILELKN